MAVFQAKRCDAAQRRAAIAVEFSAKIRYLKVVCAVHPLAAQGSGLMRCCVCCVCVIVAVSGDSGEIFPGRPWVGLSRTGTRPFRASYGRCGSRAIVFSVATQGLFSGGAYRRVDAVCAAGPSRFGMLRAQSFCSSLQLLRCPSFWPSFWPTTWPTLWSPRGKIGHVPLRSRSRRFQRGAAQADRSRALPILALPCLAFPCLAGQAWAPRAAAQNAFSRRFAHQHVRHFRRLRDPSRRVGPCHCSGGVSVLTGPGLGPGAASAPSACGR